MDDKELLASLQYPVLIIDPIRALENIPPIFEAFKSVCGEHGITVKQIDGAEVYEFPYPSYKQEILPRIRTVHYLISTPDGFECYLLVNPRGNKTIQFKLEDIPVDIRTKYMRK